MGLRDRPAGRSPRRTLRIAALALCLLTLLSAGHSALTYDPVVRASPPGTGPPGEPLVVATVDGVGPGQIVAYDADGDVVYRDDSLFLYHDVDPSPAGEHTMTYVASDGAPPDACGGERCLRNVIERANLTTGEVTRVDSWVHPRNGSTQIHDVDRINDSAVLVADISFPDRVYVRNTTTGAVTWEWQVSEAYGPESGGAYPRDWTHINDVERLPDGRVMLSLRNQDQVVFVDPGEGIQPNWTLGTDGDHATLYEAHNPDYIPASRGGPAVVIADSENNRLVEYERTNGSWERTWVWRDATMQWPRDADRLPSGRTLAVDTHGQRIVSVAPDGRIAWSRSLPTGGYDVELLGTGDESAGGHAAAALDLRSRRPTTPLVDGNTSMRDATVGPSLAGNGSAASGGNGTTGDGSGAMARGLAAPVSTLGYLVVSLVPPLVLHGVLYALPSWATAVDATLLIATLLVAGCWLVAAVAVRVGPRLRSSG
ncbi:MAG: aryl-sulfate sulfotransferase [Haloferacaceae archaeon]